MRGKPDLSEEIARLTQERNRLAIDLELRPEMEAELRSLLDAERATTKRLTQQLNAAREEATGLTAAYAVISLTMEQAIGSLRAASKGDPRLPEGQEKV